MLNAQIGRVRAALDEFEQAVRACDLRLARKKAATVESIGHVLKTEMELAMTATRPHHGTSSRNS